MPFVPLVAIDIPAEVAPELAREALRSCNLALGNGQCVLSVDGQSTSVATWLARLRRDQARDQQLRIELNLASNQAKVTSYSRQLEFEPSDVAAHRWSTAGVVVAALVISAESSREPAATSSPNDRVANAAQASAVVTTPASNKKTNSQSRKLSAPHDRNEDRLPPEPRSHHVLRLDLAGIAGPEIPGRDLRLGLNLRSSVTLNRGLMLWGAFGGSRVTDPVSVFWWSGALGLGLATRIVPDWLSVDTRLAATLERLTFEAKDVAGERDSAARWRYGIGLGLDAVVDLSEAIGVFVGIDGSFKQPQVNIRSAGVEVGQLPTTEIQLGGGFRWRILLGRERSKP